MPTVVIVDSSGVIRWMITQWPPAKDGGRGLGALHRHGTSERA
ncbi:hypothetical protein [Mycobacterium haemophilum]|nr:hypothetical protein [Mycobacterium haemophilum]